MDCRKSRYRIIRANPYVSRRRILRSRSILTLLAAGAMSFGVVTAATAGSTTSDDVAPVAAFGPAQHDGVHNEGGKPENPGDPNGGGGQSGDHGRPDDAGLRGPSDHASDRVKAVVAAAFERRKAIRLQLANIRLIPPGRERGEAVSALMGHFGELFRLAGDAAGGDGDEGDGEE